MKNYTLLLILLISQICIAQDNSIEKWHTTKISIDSIYGQILIDTLLGDTAKYFRNSHRYIEINNKGIIVVDGHKLGGMGNICGCEAIPHGYWIEKYANGTLKKQGRYYCNEKIGTWIFYHQNGQINKVENYKRPYLEMFTNLDRPWNTLRTKSMREGPYLEYYPNGQLKVEGTYSIIEEYSSVDTLHTLDPKTYELISNIVEGDFWIPKSKKSGFWNYYSEKGTLIKNQYFEIKPYTDKKIRDIESRHWEIINEIFNFLSKNSKEKK